MTVAVGYWEHNRGHRVAVRTATETSASVSTIRVTVRSPRVIDTVCSRARGRAVRERRRCDRFTVTVGQVHVVILVANTGAVVVCGGVDISVDVTPRTAVYVVAVVKIRSVTFGGNVMAVREGAGAVTRNAFRDEVVVIAPYIVVHTVVIVVIIVRSGASSSRRSSSNNSISRRSRGCFSGCSGASTLAQERTRL